MWVSQLSCIGIEFSWISSKELDRGDSLCELSPLWHVFASRPRFQVQKATRCRRKRRPHSNCSSSSKTLAPAPSGNWHFHHFRWFCGPFAIGTAFPLSYSDAYLDDYLKYRRGKGRNAADVIHFSSISWIHRSSRTQCISREAVECVANIEGLRILKLFVNSPMIRANFEKLMGLAGVTSSTFACHARPRLNSGAWQGLQWYSKLLRFMIYVDLRLSDEKFFQPARTLW